jgi:small membrane protein
MNAFQAIFVPSLMFIALLVLVRTGRHVVPWRTGILWTAIWSVAATLIAFPGATGVIAKWLGIGRGADLVLYATTLFGLGASLYFYGRCRSLEELVTGVIRRESLRAPERDRSPT